MAIPDDIITEINQQRTMEGKTHAALCAALWLIGVACDKGGLAEDENFQSLTKGVRERINRVAAECGLPVREIERSVRRKELEDGPPPGE
jgi:predicted nuclease with TOPRIM domain